MIEQNKKSLEALANLVAFAEDVIDAARLRGVIPYIAGRKSKAANGAAKRTNRRRDVDNDAADGL